jgi:hypothetical protein
VRWPRREKLPDDARSALGLGPRERVLAASHLADDSWVAATEHALVGPGWRIDWADVAHAQWIDEDRVLVLDPVPGTFEARRVPLAEPGKLPETVHERVMASIVVSRRVAVRGGFVRVVGRHDASGELVWQVVPDRGVDVEDSDVRRVVDAALAQLRAELDPAT